MTKSLITIRFSHYNEFARWCLQYCKVDFVEYGYAPLQHVLPVLSFTRGTRKNFFSDSTLYRETPRSETSTPLLILDDGKSVLADSWAIAEYAFAIHYNNAALPNNIPSNIPSNIHLARILNEQLGPWVRLITYSFVLSRKNHNIFIGMCSQDMHASWRFLLHLGFRWILPSIMSHVMHSNNHILVEQSRDSLKSLVRLLEQDYIVHRTTRHLFHDQVTLYDLALASLMAPLLNPPLYNMGIYQKWLDQLYNQDEDFRKEVDYWRTTELGQYCMHLYEKYRT